MSADSNHDHSTHSSSDDHAHGHDDGAPNFPFGEVIPEKNWQENLLVLVAAVALLGFCWLGFQWESAPLASESEGVGEHELPHPEAAQPTPTPSPVTPPSATEATAPATAPVIVPAAKTPAATEAPAAVAPKAQ